MRTIKVAHPLLCGFEKLVDGGLGIAGRSLVAQYGSVKAAAKAIQCRPATIQRWLANAPNDLPELEGPDLWPLKPIGSKSWKEIKRELEVTLLASGAALTPRRSAARFWKVDDSRLRRLGF